MRVRVCFLSVMEVIFLFFLFLKKKKKVMDVPFGAGQISPFDPHHPHRLTIIFLLFI